VSTAQYATPPGRLTVSCGLLQQQLLQSSTAQLADACSQRSTPRYLAG
jgi:hypothetical protein